MQSTELVTNTQLLSANQLQQQLPDAGSLHRIMILGPTLCGKSTLGKSLSQQWWLKRRIKSLVLDITESTDWGSQALVFSDQDSFWHAVWTSEGCLILCDEAAETINRRKDLIPVFTRMRHNRHSLIVMGHNGVSLLPIMRQQVSTIFLFRQSKKAAEIWVEEFVDERLFRCTTLNQYEFVQCHRFGNPTVNKLTMTKNVRCT